MIWKYISLIPLMLLTSLTPLFASSTFSPDLAQRQQARDITNQVDLLVSAQPELAQSFFVVFDRLAAPQNFEEYDPYEQFIITHVTSHLLGTYIKPIPDGYDIVHDDSITKYVGVGKSYTDLRYVPGNLTIIENSTDIYIYYGGSIALRLDVYQALLDLAKEYRRAIGSKLMLTSGYRSYENQRDHFSDHCKDSRLCAHEGTSEHQSGLAVDLAGMSGAPYIWMVDNAHRYGFHQTYQKGIEIDGYQREDRHRRYLGVELATELRDAGMTFGEWYQIESKK